MDRQALAIHGAADAGEVRLERYRALIRERAAGRPQYILGSLALYGPGAGGWRRGS